MEEEVVVVLISRALTRSGEVHVAEAVGQRDENLRNMGCYLWSSILFV